MTVQTRRASDGTVLWHCDRCLAYLPLEKFSRTDHRRGYVCNACVELEKSVCQDVSDLIVPELVDLEANVANKSYWQRSVWRYIRPAVADRVTGLSAKMKAQQKTRILNEVRKGKVCNYRRPLAELLSSTELQYPEEHIWLALRPELFDPVVIRSYALGAAKYAAQLSGLYAQDPRAASVILGVHRVAVLKEGTLSKFQGLAFDLAADLGTEYNHPSVHRAANALMAVCYPKSHEAALSVTEWAVQTFMAKMGIELQGTFSLLRIKHDKVVNTVLGDLRRLLAGFIKQQVLAWEEEEKEKANRYVHEARKLACLGDTL